MVSGVGLKILLAMERNPNAQASKRKADPAKARMKMFLGFGLLLDIVCFSNTSKA